MKTPTARARTEAQVGAAVPEQSSTLDAVAPAPLVARTLENVMREHKLVTRRHMAAALGTEILKTFILISIEEQSTALYAVPPACLIVRALRKVVRQHEVEAGRHMPVTSRAEILETLNRVSVKEKCAALYAVPPVRLILCVLDDLMRKH